ncbi:PREDICTED: uncharacterized protein LOC104748825 [Camelina sativa]|uniref:Uncharacterized protein LOC104748825 n=1 Tax=Camelina sativa TaxID=90675 RepID=A0ABM0WBN2_CAMSA|nr:PREDICTED: uncharacterized protein LOC104748825 [Camelina sativa]
MFRRRFRMNKPLFLCIVTAIENGVPYFRQRRDATGRLGLSALQKCTSAIRLMAYGYSVDVVDEYLRLAETTAHKCLLHFVEGVINLFGDEYLRRPTAEDLQRLLNIGEYRGFPGMIRNIDCMHWMWKNCPTAWKGQYTRGSGKPSIVLEVVASQDLWIWHTFFGPPGSLNDINVLDRSPVFDDILEGRAPRVRYFVNGRQYKMAYYLTDGIYPKWATFIQSITLPRGRKAKLFAQWQEGCLEDERHDYNFYDPMEFHHGEGSGSSHVDLSYSTDTPTNLHNMMGIQNDVHDTEMHDLLQKDLIEPLQESRRLATTLLVGL